MSSILGIIKLNAPLIGEGKDGDTTLRYITGKGLFLFIKYRNEWHSTMLSPQSQYQQQTLKDELKNISLNDIPESSNRKHFQEKSFDRRRKVLVTGDESYMKDLDIDRGKLADIDGDSYIRVRGTGATSDEDKVTIVAPNGLFIGTDEGSLAEYTSGGASALGDLTNVNIGTDEPTEGDYTDADMMPAIGDIYIRNQQTYPEIYWRVSDLIVNKWHRTSNYQSSIKWSTHIDATPLAPIATDINLYTNSGCTASAPNYRLLGESINLYAKATYNAAITLPFDSDADPNATFTNPSSTKVMSGGDGNKTISAVTSDRTTDSTTTVNWTANGVQEGGVAVQDSAGTDSMYWRNNRIAGADSGVPSDADVSDPSYEDLNQGSGYTNFTATVTVPAGGRAWFGMPDGYTANSCIINGEDQLDNFITTTRNYNNGHTTKSYKIYYTNPQAATTMTMDVN